MLSREKKLTRALLDLVLPVPGITLEIKSSPPHFPENKKEFVTFVLGEH